MNDPDAHGIRILMPKGIGILMPMDIRILLLMGIRIWQWITVLGAFSSESMTASRGVPRLGTSNERGSATTAVMQSGPQATS